MATVHAETLEQGRLSQLLTTDFCPWANRFVYWLKEPVGWFVLATLVSVIVGLYLAPIGWTLAASLALVIAVGMMWPAIAVRAVAGRLSATTPQVHEGDLCELQLAIRNRLPLPLWGLAVEGFLDRKCESDDQQSIPTVALAFVRGLAVSTYRFSIQPETRGRYPDGKAVLTCSFPFGIWTAKRTLTDVSQITVWPKLFPISGQNAMTGRRAAETGQGNRSGRTGDFLGVRDFRQGDCLRQVNWVATARSGELVVTERSGPQCASVDVFIDVGRSLPDHLNLRIRVAASVLANLHQSGVPIRVYLGKRCIHVPRGWDGFTKMMNALTDLPTDGYDDRQLLHPSRERASITISTTPTLDGDMVVCVSDPTVNPRLTDGHSHRIVRADQDLAHQVLSFWTEVRDANFVA